MRFFVFLQDLSFFKNTSLMSWKLSRTVKHTSFRARATDITGFYRKTLEKVLQSRKNRFLSQSDGFGCKPFGFSYFLKIESFSKYFVDVLEAFPNREM